MESKSQESQGGGYGTKSSDNNDLEASVNFPMSLKVEAKSFRGNKKLETHRSETHFAVKDDRSSELKQKGGHTHPPS
eukprot:CAMPEP_0116828196 /NCGR_PEP_ID=MMETSP0418-20121206/3524_1 /TAXON_ID=1158023 /ORGANISM="Astrosyne radiata, Strain 13vi08-1A" /LENGTH=76 /DNA_ID=CAMNT_0004457063 /DNA_START=147 /DNA_END=377 /DNA_ORIENTATION=+